MGVGDGLEDEELASIQYVRSNNEKPNKGFLDFIYGRML